MAIATTGWIILQFSIRAHETLLLIAWQLLCCSEVTTKIRATEHFMTPVSPILP